MRACFLILFAVSAFHLAAQDVARTQYFDKNGIVTDPSTYKKKRTCVLNDSLLLVTDLDRSGKLDMTGEFRYTPALLDALVECYAVYHDHPDLMGVRTWYRARGSVWRIELLDPFSFPHTYSANVVSCCSHVDPSLHKGSAFVLDLRKDGTVRSEGLYVKGDSFHGHRQGKWMYYNKKGELTATYEHEIGVLHGTRTY